MIGQKFFGIGFGSRATDLTGQSFGRLTAVRPVGKVSSGILWECLCSCGNLQVATTARLRAGRVKSCGCLRVDMAKGKNKKLPNLIRTLGDISEMVLERRGKAVGLVKLDTSCLGLVAGLTWFLSDTGYALAYNKGVGSTYLRMHRVLMDALPGLEVDHINGDPLDNRLVNLRICSHAENCRNMRSNRGVSKYKGVRLRKHRHTSTWYAEIKYNYKSCYLGSFSTEEAAARAYNKKALELFGEFALLNIIESCQTKETIIRPRVSAISHDSLSER